MDGKGLRRHPDRGGPDLHRGAAGAGLAPGERHPPDAGAERRAAGGGLAGRGHRPGRRLPFHRPQRQPGPGAVGDGQHGRRVRQAALFRVGRGGRWPALVHLPVHPASGRAWHAARAVDADGAGPLWPEPRHRRDAGQGAEDRLRPAAGVRNRFQAQPGRHQGADWPTAGRKRDAHRHDRRGLGRDCRPPSSPARRRSSAWTSAGSPRPGGPTRPRSWVTSRPAPSRCCWARG